jgi:predicted RNA methylase
MMNLAPFNPSSDGAMALALTAAALKPSDVLFDLGAGDGRLLIAAASSTPGLRCVGVEYDPAMAARAAARVALWAAESGEHARITILCGDAAALPLCGELCPAGCAVLEPAPLDEENRPLLLPCATIIFCYLVPKGLAVIEPTLREAVRGGARVVTNMFRVPGWAEEGLQQSRTVTKEGLAVYAYGSGTTK